MTVRNLAFSASTNDLVLSAGNLVLVSDSAAIVQAANTALKTVLGEWFLDPMVGVPYPQLFQRKNPSLALLKQTLVDALLAVKGITRVVQLDMRFVSATRQLQVAWVAQGDAGQLLTSTIGVF